MPQVPFLKDYCCFNRVWKNVQFLVEQVIWRCLKAQFLLNCFLWGLSNKFGVLNGMIFSFLCPYSLKLSLTKYRRNSRKLCVLTSLMLVLGPNSTAGCFNGWFNFITSKFRKQIFCIFWIFLKYHLGSLILKYFIPTHLFLSALVSLIFVAKIPPLIHGIVSQFNCLDSFVCCLSNAFYFYYHKWAFHF